MIMENNDWQSKIYPEDQKQKPGESWDEYYERTKDSGNWIKLSLTDPKPRHSQVPADSKQYLALWNYEKEKYEKFEITPTGFKNVETGDIVVSPFTERHCNEMKLQTELMKQALGEKDN